ncbi:hypothetical protein LTS14_008912 [Recurvomyces mirabilis]|uniref:uncharacterized protein n=1 Tax=Recurvomyces mirabilis TaxID=574656 RepID=UPI002DE0AB73|nr:hypothetical protein LTS14_008912 [Recurvomyces mirabilis]
MAASTSTTVPTLLAKDYLPVPINDEERAAFVALEPAGFTIRHPPAPHDLDTFITPDDKLFQTIHIGAAVVDPSKWHLVITGLVEHPFALNLEQLRTMPRHTITAFHECYGSPLKPATEALWRIGNVQWTGVPLAYLLGLASPLTNASHIWSEGLDRGSFAGVNADRYQKDLPIAKAFSSEVLVAYEINGRPLGKERGGPVRLVVPGWFGTNSTKWLSKLTVQDCRAMGPFTTVLYNEVDPEGPEGSMRPVWQVEINSMITRPGTGVIVEGPEVLIEGWGWDAEPVECVDVSVDGGETWEAARVEPRVDMSWQRFLLRLNLQPRRYTAIARATSADGKVQPFKGRRNHCHSVSFEIVPLGESR